MATIHPNLQEALLKGEPVEIFISMRGGTDGFLEAVERQNFPDRESRANAVHNTLTEKSGKSQEALQAFLKAENADFQSFWISNEVFVKGATEELIQKIAKIEGVDNIRLNENVATILSPQ